MARRLDTLTIACGQGGLNASKSPDLVRDTDLRDLQAITFEDDTWRKEGGAEKFNSVAIPPDGSYSETEIFGSLHQFVSETGTSELIAYNGHQYVVVGSGGVTKTIVSGMELGIRCKPVEGYDGTQKVVYLFNGITPSVGGGPWVYAGGAKALQLGTAVGTVTLDHTTETINRTAHGLTNGTLIFFSTTGTLPADPGILGQYYVVNAAANSFQVSFTSGGSAIPFASNGTGTHTVHRSTMPNDWTTDYSPRWGFMHRGRMFMGGGANPFAVYVSVLNNHSDFRNSGTLFYLVYPGEGDMIVGGVSWRNKAYIFKYPSGIYVLDDPDSDSNTWEWRRVSRFAGTFSQSSIVEADDDVYFPSPTGYFHALSAVQESGDVRSSAVMPMETGPHIKTKLDIGKTGVHPGGLFYYYPQPQSVYYAEKRKILFGFIATPNILSADGAPLNKALYSIDIHRSDPSRGIRDAMVSFSSRDECESLTIYRDPTTAREMVLAMASNGFIYTLDQSARTKDAAGYMGTFTTKEFFPYGDDRLANMRELQVTFAPESTNNSIVIKVYQDGVLSKTKTLTDSDRRMRLAGDCRKFYIVGENDTNNSSFSVSIIVVRYTSGNMR